MIVVTGGLGFIGQNLVAKLISRGFDVKVLDTKTMNMNKIMFWFMRNSDNIDVIFHLGAITDTTETSAYKLGIFNYKFSKFIWDYCDIWNIKLIYASSAATYGNGEFGFDDREDIERLKPLNLYAQSKQDFDLYATKNYTISNKWYGLKFFNVYGFGEQDKGKMASMVYHGYKQIKNFGEVKLFETSTEPMRDFIYVDDVVDVCLFFMNNRCKSGIYNVGTGNASSFETLTKNNFQIFR